MDGKKYIQFSRIFWISVVILLMWICLPPGVRSLMKNYYDWTTFLLLGLGIIVGIVSVGSGILLKLEKRRFERKRVVVAVFLFILVEVSYLYELVKPRQSIAADATFQRIHSLGILLLLGFIIWRMIGLLRENQSIEE